MCSSASPSPIDQISIITLKNCPITRTMLTKIIGYCWEHHYFPTKWKNSVTTLAYKGDSTSDPGNFRPITLQPVISKIFTTIIKNRIYDYLPQNNFIDQSTQKGFCQVFQKRLNTPNRSLISSTMQKVNKEV